MKVVKVYGELKKRLGGQGVFRLDVNTPAEAIRALTANFRGLDKWFIDSEKRGVGYKVNLGKENIKEEEIGVLLLPWSDQEVFSITPVLSGAGRGTWQIIAGIALIGLSFYTFGGAAGLFAGTGGAAGSFGVGAYAAGAFGSKALGMIGLSLVLGGVSAMLSPPPPDLDMNEATKLQNYSFSGVTNTAQVGTAIPIAYGRLYVGSSVISAGLDVDQVL
tara:strand:- start:10402 stop:11055 length:654 start_codon:yes stop_codon:yes gene_type:complete